VPLTTTALTPARRHLSTAVENKLKRVQSIAFYITSLEEMKALLAYTNSRYALAALSQ
jgi:hypothetical protein